MKILMTGHNGYLGSVMAPLCIEHGHEVVGLDAGYFHRCTFTASRHEIPTLWKDLRDVTSEDLGGFDAIVHFGALSNDPLGNLDPQLTYAINRDATVRLARAARQAGVRRLLFSSSCIMYGMSRVTTVNEDAPLDPRTPYAISKVESEQALRTLAAEEFSPVFLRNGTIYGASPRMRFDTVLNDLVGTALTSGRIVVRGDGNPWRPVVHIMDVARAFLAVLEAPRDLVHNQAINVGDDRLNCQIKMLAEVVARIIPGCEVEYRCEPDADQRTYRTDFSKIRRLLPGFRVQHSVESGARQLVAACRVAGLTREALGGTRFVRLRWLRHLLESGQLDRTLRWTPRADEAPMRDEVMAT